MTSRNAKHRPARMSARRAVSTDTLPPPHRRKPEPSARRGDPKRIAELKIKLRDQDYMNDAILRIATVLSARLTLR